jgi:hypothetical protein
VSRSGESILNRFIEKSNASRPWRADIFLADFRQVSDDNPNLAEVMIGYKDHFGSPERKDVVAYITNQLRGVGDPILESMRHYPKLASGHSAVTLLVRKTRVARSFADAQKHGFVKIAETMYLDAEGVGWEVENNGTSGIKRLVRSDSDDLMSILEERRARMADKTRGGLSLHAAFDLERTAGRATLGIGDTVKFYLDGDVLKDGVIQGMDGSKVTLTHSKFEKPVIIDREHVLEVTKLSPEDERKKKQERSNYFQQAYGFPPEVTDTLTDMHTAEADDEDGDLDESDLDTEASTEVTAGPKTDKVKDAMRKKITALREMRAKLIRQIKLTQHAARLGKSPSEKANWHKKSQTLMKKKDAINKQLEVFYARLKMKRPTKVHNIKNPSKKPVDTRKRKKAASVQVEAGGISRSFPVSRFYNIELNTGDVTVKRGCVIEVLQKISTGKQKIFVRVHTPDGVFRGWTSIKKLIVPPPNSPFDKVTYGAIRDFVQKLWQGGKQEKAANADEQLEITAKHANIAKFTAKIKALRMKLAPMRKKLKALKDKYASAKPRSPARAKIKAAILALRKAMEPVADNIKKLRASIQKLRTPALRGASVQVEAGGISRSFPVFYNYLLKVGDQKVNVARGDTIEVIQKLNDSKRMAFVRVHKKGGGKFKGWTELNKLIVPPPNSPWDKGTYLAIRDFAAGLYEKATGKKVAFTKTENIVEISAEGIDDILTGANELLAQPRGKPPTAWRKYYQDRLEYYVDKYKTTKDPDKKKRYKEMAKKTKAKVDLMTSRIERSKVRGPRKKTRPSKPSMRPVDTIETDPPKSKKRAALLESRRILVGAIEMSKSALVRAKTKEDRERLARVLSEQVKKKTAINVKLKALTVTASIKAKERNGKLSSEEKAELAKMKKEWKKREDLGRDGQSWSPKKATVVKVADDFNEGDQVKLTKEWKMGDELSGDVGGLGTGKIEDTGQVLPSGLTGQIDRIVDFGTDDEHYVVNFADGTVAKMPSNVAVEYLERTASVDEPVYDEHNVTAGVQDQRHAKQIVAEFCAEKYAEAMDMVKSEVFAGSFDGRNATIVNALLPNTGWRRIAVTVDRVIDTSSKRIGGVTNHGLRSNYDALARE